MQWAKDFQSGFIDQVSPHLLLIILEQLVTSL